MLENTLGAMIKKLRKDNGYTQYSLADELGVDRSAISNWENNKIIPVFPIVMELSKIFNVSPLEWYPELVEMEKEKRTKENKENDILQYLKICDESAAKTIIYKGFDETSAGCDLYYDWYELYVNKPEDNTVVEEDETEKKTFLWLYSPSEDEFYGIADYGMYLPEAKDFILRSPYIPLNFGFPSSPNSSYAKQFAHETVDMLQKEYYNKTNKGHEVLFIIDHLIKNVYVAWAEREQKEKLVLDFKNYKNSFRVSDFSYASEKEPLSHEESNSKYRVVIPSDELIKRLDLELTPPLWKYNMWWDIDVAEHMEINPAVSSHFERWYDEYTAFEYSHLYREAIALANRERNKDGKKINSKESRQEYARLRTRIRRLEKCVEIGAPSAIIDDIMKLITNSKSKFPAEEQLLVAIFGDSEA